MTPLKILVIGVLIYLIWALIHHKKDKSLTLTILVEYFLMAALALVIIFGIVF